MSILDIYHFIFDYQIQSSFAAFLRFITCSFILGFVVWNFHDIALFSHPNKIFSFLNYKNFCEQKYPQLSLFNIEYFGKSILFWKFVFIIFFIFGAFSAIGFLTNFSILIFLIFFISIQSRAFPAFFSGGDVISRVILLALLITDCGSKYSIDHLLGISSDKILINGFGIRIVQMTILFGYFITGFHKLKYECWSSGRAVLYSFFSGLWGRRLDFKVLKNKFVYKSLTYSALFLEIFNPILFLIKETKDLALLLSIFLHIGTIIFMRIGFFGPIMLIGLMFFTNKYF